MKFDIKKPRTNEEQTIATSLRLNKAIWMQLKQKSEDTKDESSKTYFISSQKLVELILKQVLKDDAFKLEIPSEYVKPDKVKGKKKKSV